MLIRLVYDSLFFLLLSIHGSMKCGGRLVACVTCTRSKWDPIELAVICNTGKPVYPVNKFLHFTRTSWYIRISVYTRKIGEIGDSDVYMTYDICDI